MSLATRRAFLKACVAVPVIGPAVLTRIDTTSTQPWVSIPYLFSSDDVDRIAERYLEMYSERSLLVHEEFARAFDVAARELPYALPVVEAERPEIPAEDVRLDDQICRCPCHHTPGMLHCIPCCYKCPTCGERIAAGHSNRHAEVCKWA